MTECVSNLVQTVHIYLLQQLTVMVVPFIDYGGIVRKILFQFKSMWKFVNCLEKF